MADFSWGRSFRAGYLGYPRAVETNRPLPAPTLDTARVLSALRELGIGYDWRGPQREIVRLCSLRNPEPGGLYYSVSPDASVFLQLDASVVVCGAAAAQDLAALRTNAAIVVEGDVQLVFYRLAAHLFPSSPSAGVHATAVVASDATLAEGVEVGPFAVIGRATVDAGSRIGPHAVVGDGCDLGSGVEVDAHVHLGATGVAWVWDEAGEKVCLPASGGVQIEDDCFIGSGSVIVRGLMNEVTRVGRASRLAPGCTLGHGVDLGEQCHLANNVALAGSVTLGDRCFLGSGCAVRPHVTLAADTIVGVGAAVVSDEVVTGQVLAGVPAKRVERTQAPSGIPRGGDPR